MNSHPTGCQNGSKHDECVYGVYVYEIPSDEVGIGNCVDKAVCDRVQCMELAMAGRPKTMARRTTDLEYRAVALLDSLQRWKPSLFDGTCSIDDITTEWLCAKDYLHQAAEKFSVLADHYRQKLGIEDSGPFRHWCDRYESARMSPEQRDELLRSVCSPDGYAYIKVCERARELKLQGESSPPLQDYVPIEPQDAGLRKRPPAGYGRAPRFDEETPFIGD